MKFSINRCHKKVRGGLELDPRRINWRVSWSYWDRKRHYEWLDKMEG